MQPCELCGTTAVPVSVALGVCRECIIRRPDEARRIYAPRRVARRERLGLPATPPRSKGGVPCDRCTNNCRLLPGEVGFCGVRRNDGGRLVGGDAEAGAVHWYRDPLPTNCVAGKVCGERGVASGHNLAVFYYGCSFDCLCCQNWQHKHVPAPPSQSSALKLAEAIRTETKCVCFFGGDPTPHLPHSIAAATAAQGRRPVRCCWETNGSMRRTVLEQAAHLALRTGGTIKVDCKAWDGSLHEALFGVPNTHVLENLQYLASLRGNRHDPPLLVVSTLLVPGYITADEVGAIARFLASLGTDIPYRLLCCAPQFAMRDLSPTSREHALSALGAAEAAGLRALGLGNTHLLRDSNANREDLGDRFL